jgi:FkbM family methyltransferase
MTIFNTKEYHKIKLYNGMDFWVFTQDKGLSLDLFTFGIREKNANEYYLTMLNKKDVILDLGANLGYYVVQEADIVKKVFAVEPVKSSFELLKKNVKLNNLKNVISKNIAVGEKNGNIKFYIYDCTNVSSVKLIKRWGNYTVQKIPMLKGNKLLNEIDLKPNVLRMDVEGYELEILKSFGAKLSYFNKMFMEVHAGFLRKEGVDELFDLLIKNGFKTFGVLSEDNFNFKPQKPVWIDANKIKEYKIDRDWYYLFVKK